MTKRADAHLRPGQCVRHEEDAGITSLVERAIHASDATNAIVLLPFDAAVADALHSRAEGFTITDEGVEYRGVTWRVHLR